LEVQITLTAPIPGHFVNHYGWFFLLKLC